MARKRMTREEREWQAREDLRTLQNAAEIQGNTGRLRAARVEAKRQADALKKLGGG